MGSHCHFSSKLIFIASQVQFGMTEPIFHMRTLRHEGFPVQEGALKLDTPSAHKMAH